MMDESKERGLKKHEGINGKEVARTAETSAGALAERAKALVQAKFMVAISRPRNLNDCRMRILDYCKNPVFAEMAMYEKPVGTTRAKGMSIRYADEAVKLLGNISVTELVIYDDADMRQVLIMAVDLETNLSKEKTVTIEKTVERSKFTEFRKLVGQRKNTKGADVFIYKATDDEVLTKEANLCAKTRRQLELQLIPQDIIEESRKIIEKVNATRGAEDPQAAKRKMLDAFAVIGVKPSDLEKLIGVSAEAFSPKHVDTLRGVYQAINQGEAEWKDFLPTAEGDAGKPSKKAQAVLDKLEGRKKGKPEPEEEDFGGEKGAALVEEAAKGKKGKK